jgi:hypothetical protein
VRGAGELIASVHEMGGEIGLRGDRIHFRLPRTPETPRLVEELRSRREEVIVALGKPSGLAPCGSPHCAGCYDVGDGRRIHPPKCGEKYRVWLERWEAKGGVQ